MADLSETQENNILKNVLSACKSIGNLNGTGYRWLMNCSGFCAEYNLDGFKRQYQTGERLAAHILAVREHNAGSFNTAVQGRNALFQKVVGEIEEKFPNVYPGLC